MLLRISIFLLILIVLPPIYIDRKFIKPHYKKRWRVLFFLPNSILLIAAILLTVFESYTPTSMFLTNLLLTLFLGFSVTEAVMAFFLLISRMLHRHRFLCRTACVLGVLFSLFNVFIIIAGITYGKNHITVHRTTINAPDLPDAFNGYRIVHISDLHLGTYHFDHRFIEHVVATVNSQHADMVAFTGDLVNFHSSEVDGFTSLLKQLKAKDGVYSVMGNHDYLTYYDWDSEKDKASHIRHLQRSEQAMGWQLLLNDRRILRRDSDSIAIVGIENEGKPPFPDYGDLSKATRNLPQTLHGKPFYKILLSHDPSAWRRDILPNSDVQLTLSGHTHGGQIQIFGFTPVSLFMNEWGGLYRQGAQQLFVSTGLGEALLAFRFGVWPQIDVITLQKQ